MLTAHQVRSKLIANLRQCHLGNEDERIVSKWRMTPGTQQPMDAGVRFCSIRLPQLESDDGYMHCVVAERPS